MQKWICSGALAMTLGIAGCGAGGHSSSIGFGTNALPCIPATASLPAITSGPDGALWFTNARLNTIGRLTLSGDFKSFSVPTPHANLDGIAVRSDNALWFTETDANKIGRISLDGTITGYAIPTAGLQPTGIATGVGCAPGTVYFTERNGLGILTF